MSDKPAAKAGNGAAPVVTADGKVGYLPAALQDDPAALEGLRRASDNEIRGAQVQANKEATEAELRAQFEGSLGAELEGTFAPALAGAARGLTLGGSDAAFSSIGGDGVRKRLLDYQAYAPISSAAGEIGAIAGAALLGDEAGLGALPNAVGRIGAAAGESVASGLGGGMLARGAGVLARGAVEGGAFGVGSALSERVLHDAPITGEALIGGGIEGAAGGMVASGLLHGAGKVLGAARGAFRPNAAAFDGDAEKAAAGSFSRPADAVGDAYLDATTSGKKRADLGEIWKNREVAFQDGAERIEGHSRDLQRAITEQQRAAAITDAATFGDAKVNHMDKLVDRAQFDAQADRVMQWMHEAHQQVQVLASDTAVSKLGPAARKEFEAQMGRLGKALETGDSLKLFKAADDAKRFLGREAQFGRRATGLPEAAKAFDALYQGDSGLMRVLEDPAWGKAAAAQKAVNAATAEHIGTSSKFQRGFTEEYGATAGRPNYQANSEKVSSFLGRLTKSANDGDAQAVRDMISTRRSFLDATASNYDHGPAAVKAIAAERAALDSMEKTFGAATKETSLINQVKRLQAEEQANKIGGMVGLVTDTLSKPVTTLHRMAQIQQHTQGVLDKIGIGTKKLAGAAAPAEAAAAAPAKSGPGFFSKLFERTGSAVEQGTVAGAAVTRVDFDRRAKAMAALQSNPAALSSKVAAALGPFANDAPKATAAATQTAMAGLAFLASKMPPTRRDEFTLQPQLQPTTRASDSEIAQHTRFQEALDRPTMVLDLARKGALTPDHVEAVKAVYPKLYENMRTQLFTELVDSKSELPYGRRIQLGILLDLPTDQTLAPDFVSAIQATYTASEKAGEEPPPTKPSALDVSGSLQTSTQSAASGGMVR
jgi:hypothetical protein